MDASKGIERSDKNGNLDLKMLRLFLKRRDQWRELAKVPAQMRETLTLLRGLAKVPSQMEYPDKANESHERPLHDVPLAPGVRKGRVPKDGYQRGWQQQFGSFGDFARSEKLYNLAAKEGAKLNQWITEEKRVNLYLILTRFLPKLADRNVIEFGSFRGGTALFMAIVLREIAPEAVVYALDTFEGMPPTDKSIDMHWQGDFAQTTLEGLRNAIKSNGLKNLIPVKGLFQDTFPALPPDLKFGLAHIDADIYSAVKYAQDAIWPRMTKGGYVIYDDAEVSSCLGATEAVEELIQERRIHSEQVWPHFVFRTGLEDDVQASVSSNVVKPAGWKVV